jgi:sugar lactone lactonase YvrE
VTFSVLLSGGGFFESPRWHDGRWWVSDMWCRQVLAIDAQGRSETVLAVEDDPSGLGWLSDGSLLVVLMNDRKVVRYNQADRSQCVYAELRSMTDTRINDMVVSKTGQAYVSCVGYDGRGGENPRAAPILGIAPNRQPFVAAMGLSLPNGMCLTPDGSELLIAETLGGRVRSFNVEAQGTLSGGRVWATVGEPWTASAEGKRSTIDDVIDGLSFMPDGCTLDAEGALWLADIKNKRSLRLAEGGDILQALPAPAGYNVIACMLGGVDGRSMLQCCVPGGPMVSRTSRQEAILTITRVRVPKASGMP